MRLARADSNTKKATYEISHRVVISLDGFVKSLALQENVTKKLVADGVLKIEKQENAKPS